MKILKVLTVLVLGIFLSSMGTANMHGDEGVSFEDGNWESVLKKAQDEDKLIFLDVYAEWCPPCKMLKARTFPDAKVGEFFNKNFVNYAVDAEKGEGVKLAKKYRVRGYPTLLFINGKGEVVKETAGFHNPDQIIQLAKAVVAESKGN
ncbi:MAG: thioredoxin family protein [Carboxylicivirga sp.]|jgi:thioredoxin-related protein|nr:thioredoxin family protein [Carboxylicivirga sp.]